MGSSVGASVVSYKWCKDEKIDVIVYGKVVMWVIWFL